MKTLFAIVLMLLLTVLNSFGMNVTINDKCVYLKDIYPDIPRDAAVQCGFKPGERKVLPAQIVATSLKRAGIAYIIEEQTAVAVTRDGALIRSESVQNDIIELYETAYPDTEVEFVTLRFSKEPLVEAGTTYTLDVDTTKAGQRYGTLVTTEGKIPFTYTVKLFKIGYSAAERINPGGELEKCAQSERIDITNLRSPLASDITNRIAKRAIPRGKPITEDLTEQKPERFKGEPIRLIYNKDNLKLEITVIAEENAVTGRNFRVRNPISNVVLIAKYIGGGMAVVY
jgi:flagella basal body P-ring formation protein FlgA